MALAGDANSKENIPVVELGKCQQRCFKAPLRHVVYVWDLLILTKCTDGQCTCEITVYQNNIIIVYSIEEYDILPYNPKTTATSADSL